MERLETMLSRLARSGCFPSIYRRGPLWRAHVNAAGNYWAEKKSPSEAMAAAIDLWKSAEKPMDGMADEEVPDA
jgi:hypothetical protein